MATIARIASALIIIDGASWAVVAFVEGALAPRTLSVGIRID